MKMLKHCVFITTFCTLVLFLGLSFFGASVANAEERSYSDDIPVRLTNWEDTLSVPLFDLSMGILTKVEIVLVGEVSGQARLENLDAAPAAVTAESVADIFLARPDGTHITTVSPNAAKEHNLAVFDGEIDFAGTSGTTIDDIVGIDIAERVSLTDAASLNAFTGNGTIDLQVRTSSRSRATGAGNLALSFRTSAGASMTITYYIAQPAIDLEKATNAEDADNAPGPELYVGDIVTWTYVVTNIGEVPLINLTLVDDQEGNVLFNCPQNALDVAESMLCLHQGIVQHGQYSNTATVTGDVPPGVTGEPRRVRDEDPSHYVGVGDPAIDLEKLTNGEDADQRPGPMVTAGDVVTWSYIVRNIGEIALEQLILVDDQEGDVTAGCPQQTLAVGESIICTVQGIAQLGQYTNTAVVTGTTPSDSVRPNVPVRDEDPSHYVGIQLPFCPVDGDGNTQMPQIRFLGEGPGQYVLENPGEQFVLKKFTPFRFESQLSSPYISTKRQGAPERVWACKGDCIFQRGLNEIIALGMLPQGASLQMIIIDDDNDDRINTLFTDGERDQPLLRIEKQRLTELYEAIIPETANWNVDVADSIGIYICIEQ